MSIKAPKKAKGTSKKTKKGWRKNVDISQEEDFLEDRRLEERLGGPFNEKADEDLFVIDTKAEEEIVEKPSKKWRKKREEKPLKCFQHLELKSGVDDPVKTRNRVKTPDERRNPVVIEKEKKLIQNGVVKAKAKMQKEHRELERLKKQSTELERTTRRRTKFDFDLWGSDAKTKDKKQIENDEWLDDQAKNYIMKNTPGNFSRKLPSDRHDKPSDLAPVEAPHAGLSYNPSLKDHQDLLWKAAMVEMNKERAQRKVEYHTDRLFPDRKDAPTAKTWIKEMSEGIPELNKDAEESEDEPIEESESEDDEAKSFKPKTKVQRNREKREKYAENVKKAKLEEKKKAQDLFRMKSMKKDLALKDKTTELRKELRSRKKEEKRFLPAQLSGMKFEEPEIPLKLGEELTGNLRNLKPEGNILEDRFKSFQKRNVVETRKRGNKTKIKRRKKVEKRAYKMGFAWEKK